MADGDLNIRINTSTDPKGLQEAKKQLDEVKQSAEKAAPALGKTSAGIEAIEKRGAGLRGVIDDFKTAPGVMGKLTVAIGAAVGGVAALSAAIGVLKRGVVEYAEAQKNVFQMDAALRQQGQLVDSVREKYQALAGQLQETTAIADDEWLKVITRLVQFDVGPERMDEMVQFVKNLAGAMGGDLHQATEAAIKALGGNYRAFQMLGIVIPDTTNNVEKLEAAMKAAARIGAGQLEAGATGVAGQFKQMNNSIGDAYEAIGALVAATRVLEPPIKALTWASKLFSGTLGDTVEKANGMENLFQRSKVSAEEAAKATATYTKELANFEKQAAKTTKTLTAEQEAAAAVKEILDAEAQQQFQRNVQAVRTWEKSGIITPDRAEEMIGQLENRAGEEQHQRDQDLRRVNAASIDKKIANEKDAIFKAEKALRDVQQIAKDETKIQAAFDEVVAPFTKEIERLTKIKEATSKLASAGSIESGIEIDKALDAQRSKLAGVVTQFNAGNPQVNPLAHQVEAARENLRRVREERSGNIFEYQGDLGRANLQIDSADRMRQMGRHTEAIERGGPGLVGNAAEAEIFTQLQRDSFSLFQQFSKENAATAREQLEAYRRAIQEIQQIKTEVRNLKGWHIHNR